MNSTMAHLSFEGVFKDAQGDFVNGDMRDCLTLTLTPPNRKNPQRRKASWRLFVARWRYCCALCGVVNVRRDPI